MFSSDEDAYYRALFWKSRYDAREGTPWSELSEAAQSTTDVVRDLVRSLVSNRDTLGGEELQILYHLCQNTNDGPSIEERRKLIRDLDLPSEDTERITKKIERPMGSVGSAMGDPNLEVGHPDEDDTTEAKRILRDCFKRLIENVNPVTESGLIAAVEDLITLDFHRVQSGRMSPILHYLAPEVFPFINSRSRTGNSVLT